MSKKHEVQKLEFFDSYEEFLYLVMNMNDNEKKQMREKEEGVLNKLEITR